MFSPKHFFPSENISIRCGPYPDRNSKRQFLFLYREKRRLGCESSSKLEDTRGCMQFPPVYSDVVDIEEEGGVLYAVVRAINSAESRSYEA